MTRKFRDTPEGARLRENESREKNWQRWGPYLSERQWGTIREDYSNDGSCWTYFPHEQARSRAYRWGEDGLLGISDRQGRLAFSFALWNEADPFLKERLFGLTPPQANHGEDVKEYYFYLKSSPTHSFLQGLYKYPHREFPYQELIETNSNRSLQEREYELADTGIFGENRYFDIFAEYAKATPDDILIRIRLCNRSAEAAPLHLIPQLWFRNSWSWGRTGEDYGEKPLLSAHSPFLVRASHKSLGTFFFAADPENESCCRQTPHQLFTENETNFEKSFGFMISEKYRKDAFHEYVVHGKKESVNPDRVGTKHGVHYSLLLAPHEEKTLQFRLFSPTGTDEGVRVEELFGENFSAIFQQREEENSAFFGSLAGEELSDEDREIQEQAYAGLLWSKQFYWYSVKEWREGDPAHPRPKPAQDRARNGGWEHLYNRDIISMPDKWEYPWYAAWDSAFHAVPLARVDPAFAKEQLILFLREWYMHPNGQIPAYEFSFSDVNPPVHAWACWRVYKMTAPLGKRDTHFLKRVFHKLLLNFTWWVNRKDVVGNNLFSGGFLGLDNIGVFDRGAPESVGGELEQADATAWMAFYCGTMLSIALELAREDRSYSDIASKFFEHFMAITDAMNSFGGDGLWDSEDNFYYDQLHQHGTSRRLKVRSLVGLIPLCAVEVIEDCLIDTLPGFKKRALWFLQEKEELRQYVTSLRHTGPEKGGKNLLAVPSEERLRHMLRYMLDESEFLSPYGIRSLSKAHESHPYCFSSDGNTYCIGYEPGESQSTMFGGNSNWRGPIWFPINFLIIEALERYHYFYGDSFQIECPTHSGNMMNLQEVSRELARRLVSLFQCSKEKRRPFHGEEELFSSDEHWQEYLQFYEHFHGDTGRGLGASHQTGWTALVALCLEKLRVE
jgi:hypothetical protein